MGAAEAEGIADACNCRKQKTSAEKNCGSPCIDKLAPEQAESHTSSLQHSQAGIGRQQNQAANSSKHLEISTNVQPSRQWLERCVAGSNVVWLEAMRLEFIACPLNVSMSLGVCH